MRTKTYYVYILASSKRGTLYTGVTSDLRMRVHMHKNKKVAGFTKKYGVDKLVYYEEFNDISIAIRREKQVKKWKREWKINHIEEGNPEWEDLYWKLV